MGKVKRKQAGKATPSTKHGKQQGTKRRQHSQILPVNANNAEKRKAMTTTHGTPQKQQANQRPKVPFTHHDRVLLIGEGDMSFALSLIKHYRPGSVTATCYDTQAQLIEKYPNVMSTISQLDPTAATKTTNVASKSDTSDSFEGFSPPPEESPNDPPDKDASICVSASTTQTRVLYGIDATKLSTQHRNNLRPLGPFTKIVFNFPHVGGLSTDVNRQVRANQELLVKFFEAAKPLLIAAAAAASSSHGTSRSQSDSQPSHPQHHAQASERYDTPSSSTSEGRSDLSASEDEATTRHHHHHHDQQTQHPNNPQILISLFTAHPYTLWNVRDLARHAGYVVVESFRFPWEAYPGYRHARTVGDIVARGKDGKAEKEGEREGEGIGEKDMDVDVDTGRGSGTGKTTSNGKEKGKGKGKGKSKGRWRGEDREARCFVFELKRDVAAAAGSGGGGRSAGAGAGFQGSGANTVMTGTGKRKRGGGGGSGRGGGESDSD